MSALLYPLQEDLHQAWLLGALTFQEAWQLQDQLLLSDPTETWVPVSPELAPQVMKLLFLEMSPVNQLPL